MNAMVRGVLVVALALLAVQSPAAAPIRVMLLDGESGGPCHKWQLDDAGPEEGARGDRPVPGGRRHGAGGDRRAHDVCAGLSTTTARWS